MSGIRVSKSNWRRWLALLAVWAMVASTAHACDTPVYRYAMYRWLPAPYELYCFHNGELGDVGSAVKTAIEAASNVGDNRANIVFLPVDLEEDPDLNRVPPDVKKAWLEAPADDLPAFLVSSPYPTHIYAGKLTEKDVASLVDSPARKHWPGSWKRGKPASSSCCRAVTKRRTKEPRKWSRVCWTK